MQRYLFLASLGLVMFTSGCTTPQTQSIAPFGKAVSQSGVTNFTPKTGGFSIYFPTKPTESTKSAPAAGTILKAMIYQSATPAVTYMVLTTPIPDDVDFANPAKFLDPAQKGMLESSKGQLVKSEDIHLSNIPGREVHSSMLNGAALCRTRMYLTPKVSYMVMAVGEKDKFNSQKAQIDKVFNSFKVAS